MRLLYLLPLTAFLSACPKDQPPTNNNNNNNNNNVCTPMCGARVCGLDPICGESCGACGANETCSGSGICEANCVAGCGTRVCGTDACGNSCGTCTEGQNCEVASGTCTGGETHVLQIQ